MPIKRIITTEARVFKGENISNLRKQSCEEPEQWTWAMDFDGMDQWGRSLPSPPPPCAREDDGAAADPHVILDLCEGDGGAVCGDGGIGFDRTIKPVTRGRNAIRIL